MTLALLTALLIGAPAAAAKGIAAAEACGAGGCRGLDPRGALDLNDLVPYGAPVDAPRGLPFYRLRLTYARPDTTLSESPPAATVTYVPGARAALLRAPNDARPSRNPRPSRDRWWALDRRVQNAFRVATAGLEPLPGTQLAHALDGPHAEAAGPPASDGASPSAPLLAIAVAALLTLCGAALLARRHVTGGRSRGGHPATEPR